MRLIETMFASITITASTRTAFWTIAAAVVLLVPSFDPSSSPTFAAALPFSPGDVFVGTQNGKIQHFDRSTGLLLQTLDTTINDNVGGICFDSDGNLYATLFNNAYKLAKFEAVGGTLVTASFVATPPLAGLYYKPEGCTFDSRDRMFVGHGGGSTFSPATIRRYDRETGTLQQEYVVGLTPPGLNGNGPTFLDLHCDQCTMYYTENGEVLRRYDVCLDAQLPDFDTTPPNQRYFDLRILPDDSVLVADTGFVSGAYSAVQHLASGVATLHTFSGSTYFGGGHQKICVLDLDHADEGSFWTSPGNSASVIKRIDLSLHTVLQTISVDSSTALEVLNPFKCGCAEPPADMAAWWPFDELAGPTAFDIAGGHDGTYSSPGPVADDGMVADSLGFDGSTSHVLVPDAPDLNFPTFTFTVDFWIRPNLGEARGTILRKGLPSGSDPFYFGGPGYHIYYQYGHFFVYFRGPTIGYINDISDNFEHHADPEQWTHVAITVEPGTVPGGPASPYKIELWIDGILAKVTPMTNVGDPSNSEPLVVGGSDFAGAGADHGFHGRLDELELFPRVLSPAEIQSVYLAGAAGKCKDDVHPPWDKAICVDDQFQQEHVVVDIEVCNYGHAAASYELGFKALPVGSSGMGGGCGVAGPPSFDDPSSPGSYYPLPKPIEVAGGKCKIERVRVERPVAFADATAVGKVGCYEARLRNLGTGHVKRTNGSVQATAGPCPRVIDLKGEARAETFVLVPGAPRDVVIELLDSSKKNRTMPVTIEPFDSDMSGESAPLRINGARPGEAWKHTVALPAARPRSRANTTNTAKLANTANMAYTAKMANITLSVESMSREPFGFQDVLVLADLDRETCGLEPLISIGFRSPMLSEIDLDGDGLTNDYEVAAGLSPYEPNKLEHLVKMYAQVLDDTVQCLASFLEEYLDLIDEGHIRRVKGAVKMVKRGAANLESRKGNPYKAVKTAVSKLVGTKPRDANGMKEVQPHVIGLTAATGVFVDGQLQLLGKGGRDVAEARHLLGEGKAAERMGKYYRAIKNYVMAAEGLL